MAFWGNRVIGGENLVLSPEDGELISISMVVLGESEKGQSAKSVSVYLTVEDQKFVIGTLSATRFPQIMLKLLIDKKCKISHDWEDEFVNVFGYSGVQLKTHKESTLTIGGHRLIGKKRKCTMRDGNGRNNERFVSGRGEFQTDRSMDVVAFNAGVMTNEINLKSQCLKPSKEYWWMQQHG